MTVRAYESHICKSHNSNITLIWVSGPVFYAAPKPGLTVSLTEVLFPGVSSAFPQNELLNMTFDCSNKQLDVHVQISSGVEVVPDVISFSNVIFSLRVTLGLPPTFNTTVLSANTQLFSMSTFVGVRYDFTTRKVAIKGIPTDTSALNLKNALKAVSGTTLPVPSGLSEITEVTFSGQEESGVVTIAVQGQSNDDSVAVILQRSTSNTTVGLIADIRNFNLANFVDTALHIDIADLPIFGTLEIPELGFSAATGTITSQLLPMLYASGSPLERFDTTLPKGISAYFTASVAGVSVDAAFSLNTLSFKVPTTSSLSVKQLLDEVPDLTSLLDSLPALVTDVLDSKLSGFYFHPETKQLDLGLMVPSLTVVPNILKLTNVDFMLSAVIGTNPSIQNLQFTGTWTFSTVSLTTNIEYDSNNKVLKIKATPESSGASLSIESLMKNVAGVGGSIPSALTSLSLSSIVGNVYNNGNYFIAMSGTVTDGNIHLIFFKGAEGVKVGIVASLQSFQFANLVQSTVGVDITGVPYFGSLLIPAMALSITSGVIKSPALPHLFGQGSPLLAYGDTLPAGVSSQFNLDVGNVKGAVARFYNGMLAFKLPDSVSLDIEGLASVIPGVGSAVDTLPSQIRSILRANVNSFSFNSTSKDLNIMASISTLTLVSGFLTITNVSIYFDCTLGQALTIRTLDFMGTWNIGEYAILTSVMYDGMSKELTVTSQSNGGKELSISNVVQSLAGTTVPLPAAISSFAIAGIAGKTKSGITVVVLNGQVSGRNGKISAVFQKTTSEAAGAIVIDINNFKLSEFIESSTGADISAIPFFGELEIPELKFAAATSNITTPVLAELSPSGSALEWFKTGILQGVSGRFVIQIGDSRVAVNFVQQRLNFKVPDTSSLSLSSILLVMPDVNDILSTLPSQLASIFNAKIAEFSYDPNTHELQFSGSLNETVDIVPGFVSLRNVKISLLLILGPQKSIEVVDFMGDWDLQQLPIRTVVSYNRAEERLDIAGELDAANGGVSISELITSLSGETLPVPSILSSVKLSRVSGNKIGDVTLVSLSGTVGDGRVFIIFQKSPTGSAIAFAADIPKFKFSSLVSSATGLDINSVPFFGSLEIPQIGFTIASMHISNPLLAALYPPTSPLAKFAGSISQGVSASFSLDIADAKGIIADFGKGELDLQVPDSVDLSLTGILQLIPGLQNLFDSLPQTIRDIGSTRLHNLYFIPTTKELQLMGSLESLAIIPNFLSLSKIEFEFSGVIGRDSKVEFVKFKGDWTINSLALTTDVFYEKNLLLISGSPAEDKSVNIKEFIKGLTGTELNVPSALDALKFTKVVGKIQDSTFSLVLLGEIGTKAKVAIVYEQSKEGKTVALAADIEEFQLAELVQAGAGIDITDVPFFGDFTIPAISFVVATKQFSTANLPDLNATGLPVPKELSLPSLPEGVKGQFIADIGSALGLHADFGDKILTIEVPFQVSFSLSNLISVIPEIQSTIDSLPDTVNDILSAKITKLVFEPATKDLSISLQLDSLTLIPDVLSIQELNISLDASLSTQAQKQSHLSYPLSFPNMNADKQAVSINTLDISGVWIIQEIEIETNIMYNKEMQLFDINGVANGGQGASISDIIQAFSDSSIPVPSVLSSLKLTTVVATSSDDMTTVILTAMAGNANVYILYQKISTSSATAVAAEIEAFKIVDLIKTATGLDLSGAPFIGSFVISSMAFSASTNPITSPLLATAFKADGPLQAYSDTLPGGVTAHFEVQIGGKTGIAVSYNDKQLDFVIPEDIDLTLSDLLSEMPSISSVVNTLPPPMSDLRTTSLQAMDFDVTTKTLSVAASLDQLTIIPDKMEVINLEVSFVAILSSSNGGLTSLDFSANWVLGNINLRVKVTYDKASQLVLFAAIPMEGLDIQQLISSLTGTSIPLPAAINAAQLTKVIGRKTASVSTIIFSGTIAGKADVHLVFQSMGQASQVGIAAGIQSFTFSELIQSAVNIDISGVPFFGTFSVPTLALSVANQRITSDLLPEVFTADSPLVKYGNTIPAGFTAEFDAPIGEINGIPGSYRDQVISFTVPPNVDASLGSLISVIPGIDVDSLGIGPVFGNILEIQLKSFSLDVPKKELSIEMFLEQVTFYEGILSLRDVQLKLSATFSPKSLTAEASAIIAIGDTDFTVAVGRDTSTNNYALTVETGRLQVFDIVTELSASFLPDDLQTVLESVFKFNIYDVRIVYPFGAQPQQIQISGRPGIFGQDGARLTAVAFRYSGKIRLIQQFEFPSFNIADLIEDLVGISLHSLKILDQEVDVKFVLSPSTIKGVDLSIPEFEGYSLDEGISIRAPLNWPSDCSSDEFCNVAQMLLGGVDLNLEGTIANLRSFSMTATIGNLELGGGVVLLSAGLQFVGGTNPSTGVVGSLELNNPKITLMAAIRLTVGGVKLEGSMSGCWYDAFGSSYLTICNMFLGMTIVPTPLPISGLEFGGRVEVGKQSCGKVLTAEGYVGINILNLNENYFYADVGPVTFQSFFDAFCFSVNLPKPLGDSGFPNGFKTSFSLLGRALPHAGIIIPAGYRFRGTLNILGLEAYADIYAQLPTRITAKIELPPVSIGTVFKMYRSSTETSKGPFLDVDITTNSAPSIEAAGYVNVFGISVETKLLITSSKYELEITGRFLNLFEAFFRISAQYTQSITSGSFSVEGWFRSDLFDTIANAVRNGLTQSANEADAAINGAQNKIREEQAKFDAVNADLENAKREVDSAQGAFDDAVAAVSRARQEVDSICSYRSCGSGKL